MQSRVQQQYDSKYFARRPPPPPPPHTHTHPLPPTLGLRSNSTFLEHGHVAYQIKWYHGCKNMVGNILSADPYSPQPRGLGQLVKIQLFQNMVIGCVSLASPGVRRLHRLRAKRRSCPPPPREFCRHVLS